MAGVDVIEGVIEALHDTYGFIRGRDSVSRFFLPSALQVTQGVAFEDLRIGSRVEFVHIDHPRGPRAIEVIVLDGLDTASAASPAPEEQ
jgi:cold shock CspA family protein